MISKLVKTKTYFKYLSGFLEKIIRPYIDDEKLLEKYKAIWTKIKDLKNIELNPSPVYDDRYIKTK